MFCCVKKKQILRFRDLFGMVSENVTPSKVGKVTSKRSGIKFGHGLNHSDSSCGNRQLGCKTIPGLHSLKLTAVLHLKP